MTADYRNAQRQRPDGSFEHSFCRLCAHQVIDRQHTVPIDRCGHEKARGRSTDRPTCFTARMPGAPRGSSAKLFEERKG